MTTETTGAIDLFLAMWSTLRTALPPSLMREDLEILIRLVKLGTRDGGISQSDLKMELGINQPRLSKLMKKLRQGHWIKVRRPETDKRLLLMTTTSTGRDRIAFLEAALAGLQPSESSIQTRHPASKSIRPRRKTTPTQEGQTAFELAE